MGRELICSDCGKTFREDAKFYGGSYWCESCRGRHQDAIVEARKRAEAQYSRLHNSDEADRKAMDVASQVEKNRARKSRHYRGT